MKKVLCLCLTIILLSVFCSCDLNDLISGNKDSQKTTESSREESKETTESSREESKETTESSREESKETTELNFSTSSYNVGKGIINRVPNDRYEEYPNLHNIPLSATLYKNGETITIDVNDPRLIRLINLFNNALYCGDCAYLLGYLYDEDIEEGALNGEFRLELKYEPYGEKGSLPGPYENDPTLFDTMIITEDKFILINHDLPVYMGDEQICSIWAALYYPYEWNQVSWLDLFGF